MRLVLGSALLLLSACPPPTADGCLPRPGFVLPTSITPGGMADTVVMTAGRLTLAAPPVTCIPEDRTLVTVSATLSGGGQTPRRLPATITLATLDESRLEIDLSTVQPGEYSLQLFVEPTIAAITTEVIIVIDRTRPPPPRLEPGCSGSHGRTSLGTSICFERIGAFEARPRDGGVVSFTGTSVTLDRNVLWVERPSGLGMSLDRYVERSAGQFEHTHELPLDDTSGVNAADERHVWAGTMFATTWEDGGSSMQQTANADQSRLRLIEEGRGLEFRSSDEICEMDGGCWSLAALGGREIANVGTRHVWFEQDLGVFRGLVRPLSAQRVSAINSHSFKQLRVHAFSDSAFRIRAPASLVLAPSSNATLLIERADGLFELWEPQRSWALRDATDFFVSFDIGGGQTAVFPR
ncbi:MAG: hypothetical protein ABTQ32_15165 [Myxococcaceae bacterium]